MSNQNIDESELEKQFLKRDDKNRKKMKVSGKNVLKLKKVITEKSRQKD